MKHLAIRLVVSLFTFVIGIASFALLHTGRHSAVANSKEEQAVMEVEREYIEANLQGDVETLDNLLADGFAIRTRREIITKEERLAQLASPDFAFEAINTDNLEVEVNGDSAVVTGEAYTQTMQYGLEKTSPVYRFVRELEKRDGRWQIVSVTTRCR
ncbi:MAG TPA: nuclear transport factor 2 family protein [Pyrinomonadaceae bacterium]